MGLPIRRNGKKKENSLCYNQELMQQGTFLASWEMLKLAVVSPNFLTFLMVSIKLIFFPMLKEQSAIIVNFFFVNFLFKLDIDSHYFNCHYNLKHIFAIQPYNLKHTVLDTKLASQLIKYSSNHLSIISGVHCKQTYILVIGC